MKQNYSIEKMIFELQDRMPELFHGKTCPGNLKCPCTYKSGCRLLTKQPGPVNVKK